MPLQISRKSEKIPPFYSLYHGYKKVSGPAYSSFFFLTDLWYLDRMREWRYLRVYADRKYFGTASSGFNSSAQDAVKHVLCDRYFDKLDWWRIIENTSLQSVDSFITCRIGGTIISENHIMFFNYSSPSFLLLLAPIVSVVFPSSSSSSLSNRIPHCIKKKNFIFLWL